MTVTLFSLSLNLNPIENPDVKIVRYIAVYYCLCV